MRVAAVEENKPAFSGDIYFESLQGKWYYDMNMEM